MAYSNTVKFIILSVFLVVIAFAIGMVVNLNRTSANQRHMQACTEYQQAVIAGNNPAVNPGCNAK